MIQVPSFSKSKLLSYEIPAPGKGGLNLQDLEYEQTSNQSPNMMNMMYHNGAFGKRFGQEAVIELKDEILRMGFYNSLTVIHAGTKLYTFEKSTETLTEIYDGLEAKAGVFFNYNKNIYYLNGKFIEYDGETCGDVETYAPDLVINRTPDGSYGDLIENYNRLGSAFKNTFNGDGTSTVYVLTDQGLDEGSTVTCEVDGEDVTAFSVDYAAGEITFETAPSKGQNNVVITAHKTEQEYIDSILKCKYSANYGGNNNSRVFLAGNGDATVYYSDVFDAGYWPELNYMILGNSETDVTGFGEQNDALMVFKPDCIYRVDYSTSDDGTELFSTAIINPRIGCSAPGSIQLINNRLTWFSNIYGVCTLVSTLIENEKNVQVISRNINGGYRANGLMQETGLDEIKTANFNGQYWLSVNEHIYMWDYTITPYSDSGKPDYDASRLAWFLFDNFIVNDFIVDDTDLFYGRGNILVTLTDEFNDFGEAINAWYQTPLTDFKYQDYLKNVKNAYFQVRGHTPSKIQIRYINEDDPAGTEDDEVIDVCAKLWDAFNWDAFGWFVVTFAKEFPRRCNLKKINMCAVLLTNDEVNRDMSVSKIKFNYTLVKEVI